MLIVSHLFTPQNRKTDISFPKGPKLLHGMNRVVVLVLAHAPPPMFMLNIDPRSLCPSLFWASCI